MRFHSCKEFRRLTYIWILLRRNSKENGDVNQANVNANKVLHVVSPSDPLVKKLFLPVRWFLLDHPPLPEQGNCLLLLKTTTTNGCRDNWSGMVFQWVLEPTHPPTTHYSITSHIPNTVYRSLVHGPEIHFFCNSLEMLTSYASKYLYISARLPKSKRISCL